MINTRAALVLGLVLSAVAFASASGCSRSSNDKKLKAAIENPKTAYDEWLGLHSKGYTNDLEEYNNRFTVWKANLDYATGYNEKHTSHWLGMNSMADLTQEEYRKYLGYDNTQRLVSNRKPTTFSYEDVDVGVLPRAIDWREKGAVSEVKNQGQCGSCWAFSTTGSVEGVNAIKTGTMVSLSEQELVDCDKGQDSGCEGGLMDFAFQFIIDNGGLDTEMDYPYEAIDGKCDIRKKNNRHVVSIDGFEDVPVNNEVALKKAASMHPVSVAIEADQPSFQLYQGGVYDADDCGTQLDHGVLLVGYGVDTSSGTYWIIKNSWGDAWGDKGYIKMKMGVRAEEGQCGIAMAASYPTKTGPNPSPGPDPGPEPGPDPGPEPGPAPGPEPVDVECDDSSSCPEKTTCCCANEVFGTCFEWGCCPMPLASCCSDGEHCCPHASVCDLAAGTCRPGVGQFGEVTAWKSKIPATYTKGMAALYNRFFSRFGSKVSKR